MLPSFYKGFNPVPSPQYLGIMESLQNRNTADSTCNPGASTPQMETPQSLADLTVNPLDLTAEVQSPPQNQYDSPPANITDAISPVSSRSRGMLRAASLGVNPTASRRLGQPTSSFGAVVSNVPASIIIPAPSSAGSANKENLREPPPAQNFRSIAETLHGHPQNLNIEPRLLLDHYHNSAQPQVSQESLSRPYVPEQYPNCGPRNTNSLNYPNPNSYLRRADEIGPSHRIPGIGYLGGHLIPPGWKEGDAPIRPETANELFQLARQQANDQLSTNVDVNQNLTPNEMEKFNAEQERIWKVRYHLDQVLLKERIIVYEQHQQRKNVKGGMSFPALQPPQPVNPPTGASFSKSPQVGFPYQPSLFGGQIGKAADLNSSRSQIMNLGSRSFPAPTMSPSILDPSLLPQTLESIFRTYEAKQQDIFRQTTENNNFLISWVTHYGPHLSQQQLCPGILPPLHGHREKPFFSNHDTFPLTGPNGQSIPRPPPYQTPNRYQHEGTSNPLRRFPPAQTHEISWTNVSQPSTNVSQPEVPPGFTIPSYRELSYLYDKETGERIRRNYCQEEEGNTNQTQNIVSELDSTATSQKRAAKPKNEKPKPWYHKHMAAANLPTSEISQEAMQAGLDYDPKNPKNPGKSKETSPKQSKKRPRKPTIDPKKGFPISEEAAKVLVSKGVVDRRPKSLVAQLNDQPATTAEQSSLFTVPGGLSAENASYMPGPHPAANFLFSRSAEPETAPESTIGSDDGDDPKDGDFGKRATRRKTPTPRKKNAAANVADGGNKRKAIGNSEPNKRTRLGFDGFFDSSGIDAETIHVSIA